MLGNDSLLTALIELDRLHLRERAASHKNALLSGVLDAVASPVGQDLRIDMLLGVCAELLGADAVVLAGPLQDKGLQFQKSTTANLAGLEWNSAHELLRAPCCVPDLQRDEWKSTLPAALCDFRSFMSVPVGVKVGRPMALIAMYKNGPRSDMADVRLLRQISALVGMTLVTQRVFQRNCRLAEIIDGSVRTPSRDTVFLDAPFSAVSRAIERLTNAQRIISGIHNELLFAPLHEVNAAISKALARTGELAKADRVYVFRLRAPGRLDNTHEWVAPGIEPMIAHLQDIPDELLAPWLAEFSREAEVYIPLVTNLADEHPLKEILLAQGIKSLLAVPMLVNGQVTGFLGYDAVREARSFLPGEVSLLRSVANSINALLERRQADERAKAETLAVLGDREKLQAALQALSDLVSELDCNGEVTGCRLSRALDCETFVAGSKKMNCLDTVQVRQHDHEFKAVIGQEAERLSKHRDRVFGSSSEGNEELTPDPHNVTVADERAGVFVDLPPFHRAEQGALNEIVAFMDASHVASAMTQDRIFNGNAASGPTDGVPDAANLRSMNGTTRCAGQTAEMSRTSIFPDSTRDGITRCDCSADCTAGLTSENDFVGLRQKDDSMIYTTCDVPETQNSSAEAVQTRDVLQLIQHGQLNGNAAAKLAHDFNNILAVISGSAYLLEAQLLKQNADTQDIDRIIQATDRAKELVLRIVLSQDS